MSISASTPLLYTNRVEAGRVLADAVASALGGAGAGERHNTIILALPRGGVPVAAEVARMLDAELDLILVRKLGLPGHEEFAMGAIASGGVRVLNEAVLRHHRVSSEALEQVAAQEGVELRRREHTYRGDRPAPELQGKDVILVDDGLATGATMRAALQVVRKASPARVILAVPVAPASALEEMRDDADEIVCPATPEPFRAIGCWYEDFGQTTDEEVRELLANAWKM